MAVMRVREVASLIVCFNFVAAFFTLKLWHSNSQQNTTAKHNNFTRVGLHIKATDVMAVNGAEKHQQRSKNLFYSAAYSRQPRNCPMDTARRSCLLILQPTPRIIFPHLRRCTNLRHTAEARLQFLLLLQKLHHGIRKTSRPVLRRRLHGRRQIQPNPQNNLRFHPTRRNPYSLPQSLHNPRVSYNQNCSVSSSSCSPVLQRQQKTTVAKLLIFYR